MNEDDKKDIEEMKEIMNTLKETVPELIKGIVDALYSGQNAEEFGKQVAGFYKSMIDAGMDKSEAYELTRKFMESRDISSLLKKVLSEEGMKEGLHKNIEIKIKKKEEDTGEE